MKIDLNRLGREPLPFEFTISEKELEPEAEIRYPEDVRVTGSILQRSAQIEVSGEIEATPLIDCTRCLQPVEHKLKFPFEAVFVQPEDFAADREREVQGDDLKVDILEDDSIDLNQIVREQLLLEMPTQLLCSEDCKGLCDRCGTNLNNGECRCKEDDIDPRWAALKNLK
jgi:uncharacterized protein